MMFLHICSVCTIFQSDGQVLADIRWSLAHSADTPQLSFDEHSIMPFGIIPPFLIEPEKELSQLKLRAKLCHAVVDETHN